MRVSCGSGPLRDMSHGSRSENNGGKHVNVGRLDGPWPSYFLQDVVFYGSSFFPVQVAAAFCGVRAKNEKQTAASVPEEIGHDPNARPLCQPDE